MDVFLKSLRLVKIPDEINKPHKNDILSLYEYINTVSNQIGADYYTFWLAIKYFRTAVCSGVIFDKNINKAILGSVVCLSIAVKYATHDIFRRRTHWTLRDMIIQTRMNDPLHIKFFDKSFIRSQVIIEVN